MTLAEAASNAHMEANNLWARGKGDRPEWSGVGVHFTKHDGPVVVDYRVFSDGSAIRIMARGYCPIAPEQLAEIACHDREWRDVLARTAAR